MLLTRLNRALINLLRSPARTRPKTICLFHDIERGLGQSAEPAVFRLEVDREAPRYLRGILAMERQAGVTATYNVVGSILGEVRAEIEAGGHAVAFHSYDHDLANDQLARCRGADQRIRGYRAPMSILTRELADGSLSRHGFDWVAIAMSKAGADVPVFREGVVWIPVLMDDYDLHRRRMSYESWERALLARVSKAPFAAIGLHDCYAGYWLGQYEELLGKLKTLGRFSTMDEVASITTPAGAA
jgi:peptidoglycan/xylan/chitin deacetylase (PgdA/CDA1 family)